MSMSNNTFSVPFGEWAFLVYIDETGKALVALHTFLIALGFNDTDASLEHVMEVTKTNPLFDGSLVTIYPSNPSEGKPYQAIELGKLKIWLASSPFNGDYSTLAHRSRSEYDSLWFHFFNLSEGVIQNAIQARRGAKAAAKQDWDWTPEEDKEFCIMQGLKCCCGQRAEQDPAVRQREIWAEEIAEILFCRTETCLEEILFRLGVHDQPDAHPVIAGILKEQGFEDAIKPEVPGPYMLPNALRLEGTWLVERGKDKCCARMLDPKERVMTTMGFIELLQMAGFLVISPAELNRIQLEALATGGSLNERG